MKLLRRSSLRHLVRHPAQLVLSVLGVALGVAVVLAIDLSIQSARQAFRVSSETVSGRATHQLVGGPAGVPDSVFPLVRMEAGIRMSAPVVDGFVTSDRLPGRALRLLGVDPFSEAPFRPWLAGGGPGVDVSALLATPGAVVPARGTARDAGLDVGDTVSVRAGTALQSVVVAGFLDARDELSRQGLGDVLVTDVAWAQELLQMRGRLSRIDLALPPGRAGEAALDRLRSLLPPDVQIREAGTRTETMAGMIRAFDLNLTALSLLALVFGMFLIYNAMTFSVVQRRRLLGTLRALGATRREVFGVVLAEAAVLGVVGTALGLGLGVVLGRGLVRLVTRTINDLYFVLSVEGLSVPPLLLVKGAALGVGATVLAAVAPAREAAVAPPREALTRSVVEERWRGLVPRAALAGGTLLAAGGLFLIPQWGVAASFGALFAIILGLAFLTPAATVYAMRAVRPVAERAVGVLGTMAARGVVTALSRTAPAIASLMVAVSVTVGLGIMISSFRGTVVRWLDQTLQADVYVSPPSSVSSRAEGRLPPEIVEALVTTEGVVGASTYRSTEISGPQGELRLVALDLHPLGERAFDFLSGGGEDTFRSFRREEGVLISEPLAYRADLAVGDSVVLPTEGGRRGFPVVGVFHDYGSQQGVVMMARSAYDRYWTDPAVTSLGLFLEEGAGTDAVLARLRRGVEQAVAGAGEPGELGPGQAAAEPPTSVVIRSNRELRSRSLEVFDRTFAITGVLRALAFAVAFIGVLAALMALQLERARELGVLRANGLTPGQVWTLVTAQTGLMGTTAGVLAVPAGIVLAAVMIFVVNRRSFGWTLEMELGPGVVLQAVALAVVGALLAGVYPAWKMSRTPPSEALRTE